MTLLDIPIADFAAGPPRARRRAPVLSAPPRWRGLALVLFWLWSAACAAPERSPATTTVQPSLGDSTYAALVARLSEPQGFFDTDNLLSNETGYLKVLGALDRTGVRGGAYVGVGPDQNYSYIARIRPDIAFIVDIRRDNLLHHLLLRALMEGSPTRVEFLSALTGRAPPADSGAWSRRSIGDIVAYVDGTPPDSGAAAEAHRRVSEVVTGYGIPLTDDDLSTIGRFHQAFMDAGLSLRFTTLGRPPRPYYPTYRQLVLETDMEGNQASYLASAEDYAWVRDLHQAGRIVPVVGDLAGTHALSEMGDVFREMGVTLSAFYASNVEFYLWQGGTFGRWQANLASLPAAANSVVIRSYFANFGEPHPSSVPGYYSTQILQPVGVAAAGSFGSYRDLVTREVLELR